LIKCQTLLDYIQVDDSLIGSGTPSQTITGIAFNTSLADANDCNFLKPTGAAGGFLTEVPGTFPRTKSAWHL